MNVLANDMSKFTKNALKSDPNLKCLHMIYMFFLPPGNKMIFQIISDPNLFLLNYKVAMQVKHAFLLEILLCILARL